MKNLIALGAALAALSSVASAADIDDRTPRYMLPGEETEYRQYFLGFGFGVQGSIEHDVLQLNDPGGSANIRGISADGFNAGGELDYLFGLGNGRLGAYCNGGWSNVDSTIDFGSEFEVFRKEHQFGCGLKGGLVVGNTTMLYAKFGHEWQKWSAFEGNFESDVQAWVLGGGGETMLSDNVSLDVGVDYLSLRDAEDVGSFPVDAVFEDSDAVRGMVTIRYRP